MRRCAGCFIGGQRYPTQAAPEINLPQGSMETTSAVALPQGFRSTFLDSFTPSELKAALTAGKQERILPNQVLQQEGDQPIRLWSLITGLVAVYRLAHDGHKVFLRWGVPGDTFGLATILLFPERYVVTIEAVQEGSLLAWDRPSARALALRCPNFDKALNAVMANYLDRLIDVVGTCAFQPAEQRLARVLAEAARELGRKGREGIEVDLTNEQLAVAAHMTEFTASPKLSKWQGLGLLTKRRAKIVLPSLSRFEKVTKSSAPSS